MRVTLDAAGAAPLLERAAVLDGLDEHLASAAHGRGRVALLGGEAGVGKSAVLARFVERAARVGPSVEVLRGWCEPLSTPRPLGPWADVAPGLGEAVLAEVERTDGGDVGVSRVFRAVLRALDGSVVRILILEDVHWADEASLDLIRLLARRIDRQRTLLIASYRDDEIGPGHPVRVLLGDLAGVAAVRRCPVDPLSPAGVAELAAGHPVDAGELYRVTGGNPFFVTEALAVGGHEIPRTVGDAVAGRLSRVSAAARRAAAVVAVIGSPAPVRLVAELVDDPEESIRSLLAAGVLGPMGDGVGFRHELSRRAALDRLSAFDRAALHGLVLERLRADPARRTDSALLAHHAEAAGDDAAILEHAPPAGARAAGSGAYREAAAHYGRALRVAGGLPPDQRASLLERFARASALCGRIPDALCSFQEAVELHAQVGDELREGAALSGLSWLLWPMGRCTEAKRAGQRAVRVLESLPPSRELAWAYVNMCQLTAYQDGVAAAEVYAAKAISLGERFAVSEAVWQARFHLALSRFCAGSGGEDHAWADMECSWAAAREAGFADAAAFMAMVATAHATTHHDRDRAAHAYSVLDTIARDRDVLLYRQQGELHRALGMLHRGRWDDAAEVASALVGRPLPQVSRITALMLLGLIRARRGDPGARDALDEAVRSLEPTGWALLVWAARAEAVWLAGDRPQAGEEARRGLAATTEHTDPWITGELARWVALAGGQPPSVRAAEPFALELAGDWRAAAAAWERLGCPYDAGLARLAGDVPALLDALAAFESLGARPAAAIAAARLRARGVRPGHRGPRPSTRADPHGLTDRQREILTLVAQGLTDQRIAARLHLSPKTVNHHVTAVLAKLGVHTRADAVSKLAESGGP